MQDSYPLVGHTNNTKQSNNISLVQMYLHTTVLHLSLAHPIP